MRTLILAAVAALTLSGCVTNPAGGQELSESGKVLLTTTTRIAVRHYVQDHVARSSEIVANIRGVATVLAGITKDTTVSGLRDVVQTELDKRVTNPLDLRDAHDLLDVFEALLREKIGKDEIDSAALVQVNEFAQMIVSALPPV